MTYPTTFPAVLEHALRTDPARPFVTFYDDATGERVELSLTTYANWVAKASSLLADEHGLERGMTMYVDLPPHWLGPVFLGAAWNAGLVVTDRADGADVVVCGPSSLERWAGSGPLVLACSLLPLGARFREELPAGVHDVGAEIWGQPDAFMPWDPVGPDDPATTWGLTQAQMWAAAAESPLGGGRLLSQTSPASPPAIVSLTAPLLRDGSIVLVVGAGPDRLDAIAASERVGYRFPGAERTV